MLDPSSSSPDRPRVRYGHGPVEMKCPVCDRHVRTQVRARSGKGAYACCFGMMAVW